MKIYTLPATEAKEDWMKLDQHLWQYPNQKDHVVEIFKTKKARLKPEERDLYFWLKKDPEDFIYRMNELDSSVSKSEQKRIEKEDAVKVAENKDWTVYKIYSHEASCLYGKGTKWCITMKEPTYWDRYTEDDVSFYFFIRKQPKGDKWDKIALQYDSDSDTIEAFWDATDNDHRNISNNLGVPEKFDGVDISKNIYEPSQYENFILDGEADFIPATVRSEVQTIFITSDVKNLAPKCFSDCDSLESLDFRNVETIGDWACKSCKSLKKIDLRNVKKIGIGAFEGCIDLEEVYFPDKIMINELAFRNCWSLKKISINPENTIIFTEAFRNCPIEIVEVRGTWQEWRSLVFGGAFDVGGNQALMDATKEFSEGGSL